MKRIIFMLLLAIIEIAHSQDIDPTHIYDKLNTDIYKHTIPGSDDNSLIDFPRIITTTGTIKYSEGTTNYVRWRDGQVLIDQTAIFLDDVVQIYHVLGGTNEFSQLGTNAGKRLSLRIEPTDESVAIEILDKVITEQTTTNQSPNKAVEGMAPR